MTAADIRQLSGKAPWSAGPQPEVGKNLPLAVRLSRKSRCAVPQADEGSSNPSGNTACKRWRFFNSYLLTSWLGIRYNDIRHMKDERVPSFQTLGAFRPRTAAVINGLLLSMAVVSVICYAFRYGSMHVSTCVCRRFRPKRWRRRWS